MNRVVVTGYGVVSSLGKDPETLWENVKNGKVGIKPITRFDNSELNIHVAAEVTDFLEDNEYITRKDSKRMDLFSQYGVYAAMDAMKSSGLNIEEMDENRFGVIIGSGIGGMTTIEEQVLKCDKKGPNRVSPLYIPTIIPNMAAGNIAIRVGAKGICTCVATACSSANDSIGDAYRNIKHGYSDVMIAGGTEAPIILNAVAGFASLTALSESDDPNHASIPFDKDRDGFVMGEGAGVLVLESLEHAESRGANILAEIVGYGATCDAYHITSPTPDGSGAARAIEMAMNEAGIKPEEVGYINAHGTSTPVNDAAETKAIRLALKDAANDVNVSSTKSMTGHLLGGAGGVESIITIKALENQFIPPTANCNNQDEECDLNVTPNVGVEKQFDYALSNSLGFGGHNGVLCFKRWEDK